MNAIKSDLGCIAIKTVGTDRALHYALVALYERYNMNGKSYEIPASMDDKCLTDLDVLSTERDGIYMNCSIIKKILTWSLKEVTIQLNICLIILLF